MAEYNPADSDSFSDEEEIKICEALTRSKKEEEEEDDLDASFAARYARYLAQQEPDEIEESDSGCVNLEKVELKPVPDMEALQCAMTNGDNESTENEKSKSEEAEHHQALEVKLLDQVNPLPPITSRVGMSRERKKELKARIASMTWNGPSNNTQPEDQHFCKKEKSLKATDKDPEDDIAPVADSYLLVVGGKKTRALNKSPARLQHPERSDNHHKKGLDFSVRLDRSNRDQEDVTAAQDDRKIRWNEAARRSADDHDGNPKGAVAYPDEARGRSRRASGTSGRASASPEGAYGYSDGAFDYLNEARDRSSSTPVTAARALFASSDRTWDTSDGRCDLEDEEEYEWDFK